MNAAGDYVGSGSDKGPKYLRWEVVDPDPQGLSCRTTDVNRSLSLDDTDSSNILDWSVLKTFPLGAKLQGLDGGGNMPIKINDDRGKPWVAIRIDNQRGSCLVRANSQFIRALLPADSDGCRCRCRTKDCGSRQHPNSFTVEKTEKLDPSSPDYGCSPLPLKSPGAR